MIFPAMTALKAQGVPIFLSIWCEQISGSQLQLLVDVRCRIDWIAREPTAIFAWCGDRLPLQE